MATVIGAAAAWTASREGGAGAAITMAVAPDQSSEAAGLAADIARSIAAGRRPDDHAVLCRTHRQAAEVVAALNGAGLPTSYLGAFFLRPEIKDLLALLELCCGPDGSALLRLATWPEYRLDEGRAARIIGAARKGGIPFPAALQSADLTSELTAAERVALARLADHIEAVRYYPDPASVLLHYLFGDAPYLRRLLGQEPVAAGQAASALFQLVVLARGYMARPRIEPDGGTTRAFLRYVRRLLADGDAGITQATAAVPGAVNVLTVHASKGLEFPVVYVPNLAQGRFPPRTRGRPRVALTPILEQDEARDAG
jgi:DNA helicase-2/ATP-dependent DNA helicase PcrA